LVILPSKQAQLVALQVASPLITKIKECQTTDPEFKKLVKKVEEGSIQDFTCKEGALWYRNRLCVPSVTELKRELLKEAMILLVTHPGSSKMYHDLKQNFWWIGMKRDIADFVARCLVCQKVKAEHQKPGGLLQPLPIPV